MFQVTYAGATFFTGTDLGRAIIRYARALALKDRADTVDLPGLLEDGSPTTVELLIGPASQLVLLEVESSQPEPPASESVAELEHRIQLLEAPTAVPMRKGDSEQFPSELEYE